MNYEYITALMLLEGSEAPLRSYISTMEQQNSFAYPLPLMIPLGGYKEPFPPDRVDREKLKKLSSLAFKRPLATDEGVVLTLTNPELQSSAAACLRGIHGKKKPASITGPLFNWQGLLLHPAGYSGTTPCIATLPAVPGETWQTYRYVLLKILWEEEQPWWKHLEWEVQWYIRKARKN